MQRDGHAHNDLAHDDFQDATHFTLKTYLAGFALAAVGVIAQLELGKVYEALGEREKALAAYEEFVNAFDAPDPEVAALAEEGRQGVIRMKGLRRE